MRRNVPSVDGARTPANATSLGQIDVLADQALQPGPLGQLQDRRQPGARPQVRVIEAAVKP